MKSNDDLHDASMIEQEAADWIARRAGGLTSVEAAEFDRWWRTDERRAAAVARLEAAEDRLRGLAHFAADGEFRAMLPVADTRASRIHWKVWIPWAVAASIAAAFFLTRPGAGPAEAPPVYATTEHGYQRLMFDGTIVQLNERTVLRAAGDRAVAELMRGEACIAVIAGAPGFSLQAGKQVVRCMAGNVIVRVADGRVSVLVTAGSAEIQAGRGEPRRVNAGERVTIDDAGAKPARSEQLAPAQMQEVLAWQAPRLPFAETRLADAIDQFNLYNWEQFELVDRALDDRRVSGVFRADNADTFAAYLRREHRIVSERVNRTSSSDRNSPGGISILLRLAP
jgi:transmembrane sensor